ncbi:Uncharacterised protein [Bordetella pertussis]|nr:Uncharacterised protein [Bordetella pertussis]
MGSCITSWTDRPSSASSCGRLQLVPAGMKRW